MAHTGIRFSPLAAELEGRVITPDDHEYDRVRQIWNGMFDRRPALIARCATAQDVAAALAFAVRSDLRVTVRGGGHNVGGVAVADGAVMIDLAPLNRVRVDAANRLAHVGGGARLGDLDRATVPHGLACPTGVVSRTGLGGLALGGGFGWMSRRWGLTCDHIVAAEVVLPNGQIVTADDATEPDLMWGLRGGGGNFGVVTRFTLELRPVDRVVVTAIAFPAAAIPAALDAFRAVAEAAPDDLQVNGALQVPTAAYHDRGATATFTAVWHGESGGEAEHLRSLRAAGPTSWHRIEMGYGALQARLDHAEPDGQRYYTKSTYVTACSDEVIGHLTEAAAATPSELSTIDLVPLGGAIARVASSATAFAGRAAPFLFSASAAWRYPSGDAANIAWSRAVIDRLAGWRFAGTYPNYLPAQDAAGAAELFGSNHARLVALKRRVDPNNVLRSNQNIPPGPGAGGSEGVQSP